MNTRLAIFLEFSRAATLILLVSVTSPALLRAQPAPVACAALDRARGLRLATGPVDGAYESLGKILAKQAAESDMPLQVCNTKGSLENIQLLSSDQADLAIVQSDNMLDAWSHNEEPIIGQIHSEPIDVQSISLVRWLYSEHFHVLVGPDTDIYSLPNIKGKAVWLGPDGSGSRNLAIEILHAAGFTDLDIQDMDRNPEYSLQQALDGLAKGELSALLRTTSLPAGRTSMMLGNLVADSPTNAATGASLLEKCKNDWVKVPIAKALCTYSELRILDLDTGLLSNLTQNPRFIQALIPRNLYPNQNYAVSTLAVRAMMVTTMSSHDARVESIYELLSNKAQIEKALGTKLDLLNTKLEGPAAVRLVRHMHPEVREKLVVSQTVISLERVGILLASILLLWLFLRPDPRTNNYGARTRVAACVVVLLTLWLGLGVLLYLTESPFNVQYDNPWEASWSVLRHYAQGLQTPAMTAGGKQIAFLGLGAMLLFAGWMRAVLVDGSLNRLGTWLGRRLTRTGIGVKRSQLVILNWTEGKEKRLNLMNGRRSNPFSVLVVTPIPPSETPSCGGASIEFLAGDPRSRETLEQAQIASAKSVTILASWQPSEPTDRRKRLDPDVADSFTIMAILEVRALCQGDDISSWVPITAELKSAKNTEAALHAGRANIRVVYA